MEGSYCDFHPEILCRELRDRGGPSGLSAEVADVCGGGGYLAFNGGEGGD